MTDKRITAAHEAGHRAAMADAQRCKAGAREGKWRSSQHFNLPLDADERAAWMRGYGRQFAYWGGATEEWGDEA